MKVIQMNIEEKSISKFMEELSCSFHTNGYKKADISSLKNIPLNNRECIYLLDFTQNKIIYNRGFQNVLGYCDDEISLDFIISNHHHEDTEMVNRISKAAILYCTENPANVLNNVLFISYRRKKKDGSYIKILSESHIYEINDKGVPLKGFAKITDISFMETSDVVNWSFQADNLNNEAFKNQIYCDYKNFFTEREGDIIKEMEKGATNELISEKLNISRHTVATHRKNIFKKANRHNVEDLILFCKRRGII